MISLAYIVAKSIACDKNVNKNVPKLGRHKDFSKVRYNTHAKSCNSILYTKTNSATYIWLIFGTMCCS